MAKKKVKKIDIQFYTDEVAEAIRSLAVGVEAMANSGLKNETIVVLLHDATRVGKPAIREVLFGLKNLKSYYLTEKGN